MIHLQYILYIHIQSYTSFRYEIVERYPHCAKRYPPGTGEDVPAMSDDGRVYSIPIQDVQNKGISFKMENKNEQNKISHLFLKRYYRVGRACKNVTRINLWAKQNPLILLPRMARFFSEVSCQ